MSFRESLDKRIKQRQEELQKHRKLLEELNITQQKVANDIRTTQDMINLISGALHELNETQKSLEVEKEAEEVS